VGLIIIQDTKYLDLKLDGINRVINNLLEFLHSLTVEAMKSGGLRASFLSTNTNACAGDKTPNYVLHLPFFIAFVVRSWLYSVK